MFNPGFPSARTESQQSHSDIVFEYTEDTVLFHMSEKDAKLANVNNMDVEKSKLSQRLLGSQTTPDSPEKRLKKGIIERDEEVIIGLGISVIIE